MLLKKIIKHNSSLIVSLSFVIFFSFACNPQISFAEIPVDSYCQLTIQSMQREISNFQELISLVNQYQNDPVPLEHQEKIKRIQFDQEKNALFSSFGTTAEEYVTYMGKKGREVEAYLEENQDKKQQIDDLSSQINALMDQYESSKGSIEPPGPPLP